MIKAYYVYCVKPNEYMRVTRKDMIEMMKHKKTDIMKKYGIDKMELMKCHKFFNFKSWHYSKWSTNITKKKQERLDDFWLDYENKKYVDTINNIIKDLEKENNVQEFLQLIE